MNSVNLIGRLTKEPELKTTNSGKSVLRFTLAVGRRFKQEGQPDADFINCISFGKTAEIICKYVEKGQQIAVEGRIQTGSYEKDGKKVFTTDIIVDQFDFIGSKKEKESTGSVKTGSIEDDPDLYLMADDSDAPF